jgi:hypothetical protein
MAQMRSKRKTKHRGNAAGVVEVRGRTGRPPSPEERKRQARAAKLARKPTFKGAMQRAALAGAFMFLFLALTDHPKHGSRFLAAGVFAVLAVALYTPGGYYMEMWLYRRRMAKQKQ